LEPIVGDWGGSGSSGIGVFDPARSIWYCRASSSAGAADGIFQYGGVPGGPSAFDAQSNSWPGWTPLAVHLALSAQPGAQSGDTLALDQLFAQSG
jgi:hypothetical protein